MTLSRETIAAQSQLVFWQLTSRALRFALRHRREVYQALTIAPIAIIALAAFIIGRGLGLLIEAGIF